MEMAETTSLSFILRMARITQLYTLITPFVQNRFCGIEKLERIIVDLQRFWKNNSVPNMFIYGPNEDDVEYVINSLFDKEYGDTKKDMICQ